jgi:hypothetical protein
MPNWHHNAARTIVAFDIDVAVNAAVFAGMPLAAPSLSGGGKAEYGCGGQSQTEKRFIYVPHNSSPDHACCARAWRL